MSTVEYITTESRPNRGNLFSHATKIPGLIFLTGQTPIDKAGNIIDGDIKKRTEKCISNLGEILEAAGSSWEKVVKVNVYLKNMDDYPGMNEVYETLVPNPKPARTCIQVAKLPRDNAIEIEAIATY